jgi:ADP-heptose:LPS heptosyltransferase
VSAPAPDDVGRIAVLRANRIGDLVFALPALDALRGRFPEAEIVLLGRPWHAELLEGRPSPVDRVETIPGGVLDDTDRRARRAFVERMRGERFDLAIQLHGGGRHSNALVRDLGASLTIGMRTPDAAPLDRWIPYVYHQHEIVRYLDVVALAGAAPLGIEPTLAVTGEDLEASRRALAADVRPLAVLHPGATDPRRRWPAAAFARVGDVLAGREIRVVATGTADERDLLAELARGMRSDADVVTGTSLPALLGLLARASLVVANDTGPLHLAGAVGTPTVGIYWCGNLVNGGPLSVERNRHATSWRTTCPVCGADNTSQRCEHDASFVADVPVEEVVEAMSDLLARHAPVGDDGNAVRTRAADRRRAPWARRPRDRAASSAPPGGTRRTA